MKKTKKTVDVAGKNQNKYGNAYDGVFDFGPGIVSLGGDMVRTLDKLFLDNGGDPNKALGKVANAGEPLSREDGKKYVELVRKGMKRDWELSVSPPPAVTCRTNGQFFARSNSKPIEGDSRLVPLNAKEKVALLLSLLSVNDVDVFRGR